MAPQTPMLPGMQRPPPQAMGGMGPGMDKATMGKLFKAGLQYPQTRQWAMDGLVGMNKPGAERWRPMTGPERTTYGLKPGVGGQMSTTTGKASSFGGSGVTVNTGNVKPPAGYEWGPDGTLAAIEGGPATKPSDAAVKQQVQSELGLRLLNEVDTLVAGGVETGTGAWAKANAAASPILSWAVDLSADEAKGASNLEMLSNIMLAAQRGAQVGPEEQKRYDKQLPRLGQEKSLFTANLAATKRNLKEMTTRMVEVRKQQGGRAAPPPPPGFTITQ